MNTKRGIGIEGNDPCSRSSAEKLPSDFTSQTSQFCEKEIDEEATDTINSSPLLPSKEPQIWRTIACPIDMALYEVIEICLCTRGFLGGGSLVSRRGCRKEAGMLS
jgi:hypothetical protein